MGWAFDTPGSAKEAHGRLTDKYPERFRWWRKGKDVACLWRDAGTTDKCLKPSRPSSKGKLTTLDRRPSEAGWAAEEEGEMSDESKNTDTRPRLTGVWYDSALAKGEDRTVAALGQGRRCGKRPCQ